MSIILSINFQSLSLFGCRIPTRMESFSCWMVLRIRCLVFHIPAKKQQQKKSIKIVYIKWRLGIFFNLAQIEI